MYSFYFAWKLRFIQEQNFLDIIQQYQLKKYINYIHIINILYIIIQPENLNDLNILVVIDYV